LISRVEGAEKQPLWNANVEVPETSFDCIRQTPSRDCTWMLWPRRPNSKRLSKSCSGRRYSLCALPRHRWCRRRRRETQPCRAKEHLHTSAARGLSGRHAQASGNEADRAQPDGSGDRSDRDLLFDAPSVRHRGKISTVPGLSCFSVRRSGARGISSACTALDTVIDLDLFQTPHLRFAGASSNGWWKFLTWVVAKWQPLEVFLCDW
jgi:hypothetical protein